MHIIHLLRDFGNRVKLNYQNLFGFYKISKPVLRWLSEVFV